MHKAWKKQIRKIWINGLICCCCLVFAPITVVQAAPILKLNSHGHDVIILQQNLQRLHYAIDKVNGQFTENTLVAVKAFQVDHNLAPTGIVDRDTWWQLKQATSSPQSPPSKPNSAVVKPTVVSAVQPSLPVPAKPIPEIKKPVAKPVDKPVYKPHVQVQAKNKATSKNTKKQQVSVDNKRKTTSIPISINTKPKGSPLFGRVFLTHSGVKKILAEAHKHIGVPYVFGGHTPEGFDCSGYLQYIFAKFNVAIPRTADEQYFLGVATKHSSELVPGDLVFFNTYDVGVTHCGIYLGDNRFIHASSSRGVRIDSLTDDYWSPRFIGGKHIVRQ